MCIRDRVRLVTNNGQVHGVHIFPFTKLIIREIAVIKTKMCIRDRIYMVTKAKDTIDYDFKVLVPAHTVNSISCEFAKPGSEVTLLGDYFICLLYTSPYLMCMRCFLASVPLSL